MTPLSSFLEASGSSRGMALRLTQWVGGLSLSSVILLLLAFLTTIILRRKGYGVRLGFACLIFSARPGARRFPDGCEVRVSTRVVGFFFGGCRGPWLDVYAERFYMRLRPSSRPDAVPSAPTAGASVPATVRKLVRLLRVHVYSVGIAAVETGYWSTLCRNIVVRLVAFLIRGLRVRVEKVRVWKDGGSWEYKAEQFVLAGRASGVFGSRYMLSVNELYVCVCKTPHVDARGLPPLNASLVLRRGVEINAYLTPRFFTLLRPRRMAIMDDLRIAVSVQDVSCTAPGVLEASVSHVAVELCPGYSRGLRAKLPPSAPATKRPRKPGILRYWEGNGAFHGLSVRLAVPVTLQGATAAEASSASMSLPASVADAFAPRVEGMAAGHGAENGGFLRVESVKVDAYGKAADERHEAMTHASMVIKACSAGSLAVDALSHALYETISESTERKEGANLEGEPEGVESKENVDKIVAARPEALVWLDNVTAAVDINCSKRHSSRVDIGGTGGILAIEPVGLVKLIENLRHIAAKYSQRPPRRVASVSSMDTESISSMANSSSGSSLQSSGIDGDAPDMRIVSDVRHLTAMVLGHGPVGDSDTIAIVASTKRIALTQVDICGGYCVRIVGSTEGFSLTHFTQWARTMNMECRHATFNIHRGAVDRKKVTFTDLNVDWDLDLQSGLESIPGMFAALKKLKPGGREAMMYALDNGDVLMTAPNAMRSDFPKAQLTEAEREQRRKRKRNQLTESLTSWSLQGTNIAVRASFPDGPKLGVKVAEIPLLNLNDEDFKGRHVVFELQESKCLYGAEVKLESPLHTMNSDVVHRKISLEVQGLRMILEHDFQFGCLLQDWLIRLRSVIKISKEAKLRRRGILPQKTSRKPLPDIYFKASDVELYIGDHPVGGFLTRMLPLFQDESRERLVRAQLMQVRVQQLHRVLKAKTSELCMDYLKESDSSIWVSRVKSLKEATPALKVADGYLPALEYAPAATLVAAAISFELIMDEDVREHGSKESIRRLKTLDDYELGSKKFKKTRHYESDAWNSIGFRCLSFEAIGVRLRLRDFDVAFAVIDRMRIEKAMVGQAVQATVSPYVAETTVAVGRRRVVTVAKGLGPTKSYADIHLIIDTLQCGFNPAFLGAIADFGKGVSRFFGGGKNPSPRIPWFDSLRVNMHGRMRITARKLKGHLSSSISPYSMSKHYTDVEADNFEMLTSRMEATEQDPFPIAWTLHKWKIRPSNFDDKLRSEVVFDYVRVGLNPLISTLSGDAQDHYFVPFPSKTEVDEGGLGIGSGTTTLGFVDEPIEENDNGFGTYTDWITGLHEIPDFDSFKDFKTDKLVLGIDVCVRHAGSSENHGDCVNDKNSYAKVGLARCAPPGASIVHSDAISTLTKVIKRLVSRPISCRLAPRRVALSRKPPSKTGLSTSMVGLDLTVHVQNLNVMLFNNLEPGHGLFISIGYLYGEMWKRTHIEPLDGKNVKRTSKLVRKRFDISDLYSSIRVPGLEMGADSNQMGKLLSVDKISLSDDLGEEMDYVASPSAHGVNGRPVSGFGSDDLDSSPFYTFSANHPMQRGKKLDKVEYDKRLLVDRLRLVWSPARRASVSAWPDAFKEKVFCMRAPKVVYLHNPEDTNGAETEDFLSEDDLEAKCGPLGSQFSGKPVTADMLGNGEEVVPSLDLPGGRLHIPRMASTGPQSDSESPRTPDAVALPFIRKQNESMSFGSDAGGGTDCSTLDPLSPLLLSKARSQIVASRRPVGSMVDLLSPKQTRTLSSSNEQQFETVSSTGQAAGEMEVLKTNPRYTMFINDCQVVFGSRETSGYVFLTSNGVRVGVVDKLVRKNMQLGETNEKWSDREWRVHLNKANFYTRSKLHGKVDFSSKLWVPAGGRRPKSLSLVTRNPISMDLIYISSSSTAKDDEEEIDDHVLRPSLLFINIPDISLSTNADEFHATVDVVRKVLMQSMRSSEVVNEELDKLRYDLQLSGRKVSSDELDEYMRRLSNVTKQFLYAGDTFQEHLVKSLLLPHEASFSDTLRRYKARAKAVATYMRQDQKASSTDVLYPTMYVSYSFDKCSWELREHHREIGRVVEYPFVEISLHDMVCRHIFYVGRGSSAEMTFGNISAVNKIKSSYFKGILQPASTGTTLGPDGSNYTKSKIKSSDGAPVAFRWYSTQRDRVGGCPVYDLLTIQLAPMTASVTTKLYKSMLAFMFPTRSGLRDYNDMDIAYSATEGPAASRESSNASALGSNPNTSYGTRTNQIVSLAKADEKRSSQGVSGMGPVESGESPHLNDLSQMAERGESSMLFKYVFIDAFELTASYKNKEATARGVLDFFDLFVRTPTFSYSNKEWTWKAFAGQLRKDLLMTFARRGVSNLAKIKLLPGYSRAKRRLSQSAGVFRESIYSRLPSGGIVGESSSPVQNTDEEQEKPLGDDADDNEVEDDLEAEENVSSDIEEEDRDAAIDAAVADISCTGAFRREEVLAALYGPGAVADRTSRGGRRLSAGNDRRRSQPQQDSESSGDSAGARASRILQSGYKPPIAPGTRSRGAPSIASQDGQVLAYPQPQAPRASLLSRIRRKAHDLAIN